MFTARYGLGPYITQIRFVFKRLSLSQNGTVGLYAYLLFYKCVFYPYKHFISAKNMFGGPLLVSLS